MHPILLKFGPLNIYSYGVMVAVGFTLATALMYRRAAALPSFGIAKDTVVDASILMLISGIIGGRILYVATNFDYYLRHPLEILNLSRGGLIWYGGFILAFVSLLWYSKRKKLGLWSLADFIAPYAALAQAFGRIGCFLNGCCYGIGAHPVQIYSSLALFLIFAVLRRWQDARHFKGEIFLGYCILYSTKRFLMEFLRGDNARIFYGLTMAQCLSAILFAVSFMVFLYMAARWRKNPIISK